MINYYIVRVSEKYNERTNGVDKLETRRRRDSKINCWHHRQALLNGGRRNVIMEGWDNIRQEMM